MKNPFIVNGYAGAEFFCDRVAETARLVGLLQNGNNVVLSAPRRIGKTDLISHVFAQPEIIEEFVTIKADIYATQSVSDFVNTLGKAIVDALRSKEKRLADRFVAVLSSLRSEISFDINGLPVWSIGIGQISRPEVTLDEIFQYLRESEKPCVVAIDEFQQITKYVDAWRIEALLRTYIQDCPKTRFIFSGSHRHLMAEIFNSPSRPFFQSTTPMSIAPLDKGVYADFCREKFHQYGRFLGEDVVETVYDMFDGITAYMHKVMNELFASTDKGETCTASDIQPAVRHILDNASDGYTSLYYQMSERQRALMLALAKDGKATAISSGTFVKRHRLHSASSVLSAAKTLLEKDFITREKDTYFIYDRFFEIWLKETIKNFD